MPGYGFADDELQKLFAEAGEAVKKKVTEAAAPAPAPVAPVPPPAAVSAAPVAPPPPAPAPPPVADDDDFKLVPPVQRSATPVAPVAAGDEVRLTGGEQTDAALVGRTQAGQSVTLPWGQIRGLSVGRLADKAILAFVHGGTLYYFSDDNVSYRGLLKQMASTQPMNWRALVNELAAQIPDKSEAGVQAITGGGGMIPKYLDQGAFFNTVRAR